MFVGEDWHVAPRLHPWRVMCVDIPFIPVPFNFDDTMSEFFQTTSGGCLVQCCGTLRPRLASVVVASTIYLEAPLSTRRTCPLAALLSWLFHQSAPSSNGCAQLKNCLHLIEQRGDGVPGGKAGCARSTCVIVTAPSGLNFFSFFMVVCCKVEGSQRRKRST
jgi:hypothetical protein